MLHLDARVIRERLNSIALAISTLEQCACDEPQRQVAEAAQQALREIATVVTGDEMDEHGEDPPRPLQRQREAIRDEVRTEAGPVAAIREELSSAS